MRGDEAKPWARRVGPLDAYAPVAEARRPVERVEEDILERGAKKSDGARAVTARDGADVDDLERPTGEIVRVPYPSALERYANALDGVGETEVGKNLHRVRLHENPGADRTKCFRCLEDIGVNAAEA